MVRRNASVWRSLWRFSNNIAHAADRMDEFGSAKTLVNFIPQPAHACFHDIGLRVEVIVPDMFHDHGFGNDPAGISHKILQQRKFARLEIDFVVSPRRLTSKEV